MSATATRDDILAILAEVKDPEIPFIDVVELGIVRDVAFDEREIREILEIRGFENVDVRTIFSPAWTTDWMSGETKRKFRDHGVAPPSGAAAVSGIAELVSLRRAKPTIECPFCGSANTVEKSEFGSTACKSIHFCESCRQPFDHFKPF